MDNNRFLNLAEIEPLCVLRLLLRKWYVMLCAALSGAMVVFLVLSMLVTYQYTSSATFAVTSRSSSATTYTNANTASEVAAIYTGLFESELLDRMLLNATGHPMAGNVSAEQVGSTNLLKVTATADSPREALETMQAVVDNYGEFSEYVSSTAVLQLISDAKISAKPVKEYDSFKLSLLAAVGCALFTAAVIVWFSVSSGTVQTVEGARSNVDAPIIATVPHERARTVKQAVKNFLWGGKRQRASLVITSPSVSFTFTEAIHKIAARFENERQGGKRVFLFTSVSEAEGKSTVTANVALSLAEKNKKVLLIDLDLRKPVQSEIIPHTITPERSFGHLLKSDMSAEDILKRVVFHESSNLHLLGSTESFVNLVELLSSARLGELLSLARRDFDYVILDSPPVGYFADSELLAELADVSVLVIRQDVVPAPYINDAIDALNAGKAKLLGCVLNDMNSFALTGGAYGYGYGYGYGQYGKYGKYGKSSKSEAKGE